MHDSYWTHACDVDKMSEIIRETFIALHSSDILRKLEKEVSTRLYLVVYPLEHDFGTVPRALQRLQNSTG